MTKETTEPVSSDAGTSALDAGSAVGRVLPRRTSDRGTPTQKAPWFARSPSVFTSIGLPWTWAGAVAIAVLAFGCSRKATSEVAAEKAAEPAVAAAQIKLALDWVPEPEFGGFYAARESGAYKRHGLDVQIQGGGAGVPVAQMVAAGQADFGTIGGDELLLARARGADLVAVFATFQTFPQGIMVHAARHMTRIEQVFTSPGTLAMEPGVPYATFLKSRFSTNAPGSAKMVPYDGGVARFIADPTFSQQCFVTSEPIAARKQGADPQVFLIADAGYNPYATVVVTRRKMVTDNPERVAAFIAATREGWQSYLDDPAAVDAVLARLNPALDATTMGEAAAAQKPLVLPSQMPRDALGTMSRDRWAAVGRTLHELKLLENEPPIDPAFVDEAALGNAAAGAKVKP